MAEPEDAVIRALLCHSTATEARAWLSQRDGVSRTLGESDSPERARALVESFYAAGAVSVIATEIMQYAREDLEAVHHHENTGHLVLELPTELTLRRRVFHLQGRIARGLGFDPTPDQGQRYLYCMLD